MESEQSTTQTINEASITQKEKRKVYMRNYMKKRYDEGGDAVKAYNNALKVKAKHNLSSEEFKTYGEYLVDICKIRQIKEKLPIDMWNKCILELTGGLNLTTI